MPEDNMIVMKAFEIVLLATAPVLVTAMVVGLVVGLLQTVLQVQDQTVGYVLKLAAVAVVLLATASWIMRQLKALFDLILGAAATIGQLTP